jgi:DNA-binding transcriptional MerR regulator/methylmalonyl-CoA mutase cobalamin-binding subunit
VYTIKQAAARTGIPIPVLRAWERRYAVVRPKRTPSGYRVYDEEAIARLRAMRHLVDQGWSRSAAAAELNTMGAGAIRSMADAAPPFVAPPPRREADAEPALVARFVESAARLDTQAVDAVLDEMFAMGSFEFVADRYLFPALRELGDAWEAGAVDVAAEHAASHAVLRRLGTAYEAATARRRRTGTVVVGLPPGARHELGALAFSVAARRGGLPVVYEGPDLPAAHWLEAVARTRARAAVIGIVRPDDRAAAADVAHTLRSAQPDLLIAFGGGAAPPQAGGHRTISLPDGLAASVESLRAALR